MPLTVTHVIFFIVVCGITRFLCAMRVFDVRESSSSLDYLCAKFRYFHNLHCWASSWRTITYSRTQSPSLFAALGTEAFAAEQGHNSKTMDIWQLTTTSYLNITTTITTQNINIQQSITCSTDKAQSNERNVDVQQVNRLQAFSDYKRLLAPVNCNTSAPAMTTDAI